MFCLYMFWVKITLHFSFLYIDVNVIASVCPIQHCQVHVGIDLRTGYKIDILWIRCFNVISCCDVSCERFCNKMSIFFYIKTRGIRIQKQTNEFVTCFSVIKIDTIIIGTPQYFLGDCTLWINQQWHSTVPWLMYPNSLCILTWILAFGHFESILWRMFYILPALK